MGAPQGSFLIADQETRKRLIRESREELERLINYHRPIWRRNLIAAHRELRDRAHGIDISSNSRGYAQRLETQGVTVRSNGDGEVI